MFCTLHKWLISRSLDESKPMTRLVARHVSHCPTCARFTQRLHDIARRLSDEANREAVVGVSPELHEKILRRCRPAPKSSGEPTTGLRRLRLPRPTVALTAAAAMVLLATVGVYLYSRSHMTPKNAHPVNDQGDEPPAWLFTAESLSAVSVLASASVVEDAIRWPAENEIRLLRQDGKAAAEFVLACIPLDLDPRRQEPLPLTQPAPNGG